jgi:DNA-directed RNA polymerase subunit N (RpoN/RPB10)
MEDDQAVSCLLCLQADEYGSMLKVQVGFPGVRPYGPIVICLDCGAKIGDAWKAFYEGDNARVPDQQSDSGQRPGDFDSLGGGSADVGLSDLPERIADLATEVSRRIAEDVTGSATEPSKSVLKDD